MDQKQCCFWSIFINKAVLLLVQYDFMEGIYGVKAGLLLVQKLSKSRPVFGPKIEQKQYCFWSNMTSWKEFMGLKQACFWSKNQAKAALLLVHFYKQKQYCFWSNMTSGKQFIGLKQACFWSKNQAKVQKSSKSSTA